MLGEKCHDRHTACKLPYGINFRLGQIRIFTLHNKGIPEWNSFRIWGLIVVRKKNLWSEKDTHIT